MNPGKPGEHGGNEPLISVVQTAEDLATARAIRHQIFVQEQGIPAELDDDGLDDGAIHTLLRVDGKAVGTGRLVLSSTDTGILARIAVLTQYRGRQFGGLLLGIGMIPDPLYERIIRVAQMVKENEEENHEEDDEPYS